MKQFLFLLLFSLLLGGCSAKQDSLHVMPNEVSALTTELTHLSPDVDYQEARMLAYESLQYPQVLAERYGLVYPPTFHNFLINTGLKERGLCYQWSEDMITHLKSLKYQSFDLRWGVANKGEFNEHNSVVVVAKGAPFRTGILIDPWRNSGVLYWAKIGDDPDYKWVENLERSRYYGTIER
jgi:hypothetical protein